MHAPLLHSTSLRGEFALFLSLYTAAAATGEFAIYLYVYSCFIHGATGAGLLIHSVRDSKRCILSGFIDVYIWIFFFLKFRFLEVP